MIIFKFRKKNLAKVSASKLWGEGTARERKDSGFLN